MKKCNLLKIGGCIVFVLIIMFAKNGHIHLPGHGNVENQNHNIISWNGLKERHTAHVVCNEDKDKIIEWKDL